MPPLTPAAQASRSLALVLLFGVSLLNYLDRFALGVLLPKIGADLRLNDVELGFISSGLVAIVYALAGIPIGRIADRRSRRLIVAAAVFCWSLMTGFCGLAQNFIQLAAARILVGVGQAGATAPSNALISDLFEPRHRAAALSVYAQGLPAGVLLGFLLGGLLADQISWRIVLFIFALPGLLLAPVLLRWLPETMAHRPSFPNDSRSTGAVIRQLLSTPCFLHAALGSALFTVVWLSLLSWLPTFLLRSHGLSTGTVAARLAVILGLSQMMGLLAGGLLSDRLARTRHQAYLWVCAGASLLSAPFLCGALTVTDPGLACALLFPGFLIGLMQGAPALAVIQAIGGPDARAVAVSTYLVAVNLVGGLGSQLVGILSDRWSAALAAGSLGAALLTVIAVCGPWSALHFFLAGRSFARGDWAEHRNAGLTSSGRP